MRITSSYGMKLTGDFTALETSIRVYRQALSFIIPIINEGWEVLSECEHTNQKYNLIEKWIHSTTKNQLALILMSSFRSFQPTLGEVRLQKLLALSLLIAVT